VGRRHDGRVDLLCDVAPDVGVSQPLTANTVHVAEPAGGVSDVLALTPAAPSGGRQASRVTTILPYACPAARVPRPAAGARCARRTPYATRS